MVKWVVLGLVLINTGVCAQKIGANLTRQQAATDALAAQRQAATTTAQMQADAAAAAAAAKIQQAANMAAAKAYNATTGVTP